MWPELYKLGACRKVYLSVFSVAVKNLFSLLPKYNNSYNRYFKGNRLTSINFSAVGSTTIDEKQDSELVSKFENLSYENLSYDGSSK